MNYSAADLLAELESEVPASRKCIEKVPESLFKWKPHEKSMEMGYVCLMMADIPRWISTSLEEGVIDFGTFGRWYPKDTNDLLEHFDKNVAHVKEVLAKATAEDLKKTFSLRNNGQDLMSMPMDQNIASTINHWVHHRGQLTVYLRLNNLPVPSIYGPSADEKTF